MNKFKLAFLLAATLGVATNGFSMEEEYTDYGYDSEVLIVDEKDPKKVEKNAAFDQRLSDEEQARIDADEAALGGPNILDGFIATNGQLIPGKDTRPGSNPPSDSDSNKEETAEDWTDNVVNQLNSHLAGDSTDNQKGKEKRQVSEANPDSGVECKSRAQDDSNVGSKDELRRKLERQSHLAEKLMQKFEHDSSVKKVRHFGNGDDSGVWDELASDVLGEEEKNTSDSKGKKKAEFVDASDDLHDFGIPAEDDGASSDDEDSLVSKKQRRLLRKGQADAPVVHNNNPAPDVQNDAGSEDKAGEIVIYDSVADSDVEGEPFRHDEVEDEITVGDNFPGRPNPRGNQGSVFGFFSNIYNYFASDDAAADVADDVADTEDAQPRKSRFARHKKTVAVGGIAVAAVIAAGLVYKKMSSKSEDQATSTPDEAQQTIRDLLGDQYLSEDSEDEDELDLEELVRQLSDSRKAEKEASAEDTDSEDSDEKEESNGIDYKAKYANNVMYKVPFNELCRMLDLSTIDRMSLNKSLDDNTFLEKLEEMNADCNVKRLAKVVMNKFVQYQQALNKTKE